MAEYRPPPDHNHHGGRRDDTMSSEATPLQGSRSSFSSARRSIQPKERNPMKERCNSYLAMSSGILALLIGTALFLSDAARSCYESFGGAMHKDADFPQQYDELGRYIVEDYDARPAFSDFLPGLAGIYGKPLYAFYVNRGQGIASFGVESKDYPIMEFQPANKAYQTTSLVGFRTFLQGSRGTEKFVTEPFGVLTTRFPDTTADFAFHTSSRPNPSHLPKRYMYVGRNEMQIQEVDPYHDVETNVTYFILPEENFGAFVRRTTFTNTAKSGNPLVLSLLDGLARMEPAGGKLGGYLKDVGNTLEGFMNVYSPYEDTMTMPFYRVTSQPADTAATTAQISGHYCLSMIEGDPSTLLPIIYDPQKVFGDDTTMLRPVHLMSRKIADIIEEQQHGEAKTPSAFAAADSISLKPGKSITMISYYGKAEKILDLPVIAARLAEPGFGEYKRQRAREIVKQVTAQIETKTAVPLVDGHIRQMFLDSGITGGVPTILGEVDDDASMKTVDEDERLKVYHLFSRIHGDLERDFNDFQVSPTFFSEGPGHFNVLAQHRRNDIFFVPRVGTFNIKMFLSLLQADGYNPLTVESITFTISNKITCSAIAAAAVGQADGHRQQREALTNILSGGPFRLGQLFELMDGGNIELIIPIHEFVDRVAAAANVDPVGVYEAGFWADHWTYIMDFVDSYLAIYPDQEERLLFDDTVKFFFSPARVLPRSQKYVLSKTFDGLREHIRQLGATSIDPEKMVYRKKHYYLNTTGWFSPEAKWQHDSNGNIFRCTPMEKLVLLATLKFSTRDAYGMGIEYEADKPGYNTAMNGLPAMLGSGVPEAHELLRLLKYLASVVSKFPRPIRLSVELYELMKAVNKEVDKILSKKDDSKDFSTIVPRDRFLYWDRVASAREAYRERVRIVFDGATKAVSSEYLESTFASWIKEVDSGLKRAMYWGTLGSGDDGTSGLPPTYFSYNITKWEITGETNSRGHPLVNASQLVLNRYPLFLEGPACTMSSASPEKAKEIYSKVRASPLRDDHLGMYTLSASLKDQNLDIGRVMSFAPGWLENESVWMDMSYKFYKQLIRKGMHEEFFYEMKSGGMLPFMHPEQYGRSLMECSTFIASSAINDPTRWGRGFYARLSGATAEFLSMWISMFIGDEPFSIDKSTGLLQMQLLPAIPAWLFAKESSVVRGSDRDTSIVSFKLFGNIDVRYFNERGGDLFRVPPYKYVVGYRDGSTFEVDGAVIPFGLAERIRRVVFVASIDVYFG